jgi:3-dehydroquinate dehydratase
VSDALRAARIPLVTFPIYRQYDREKIKRHIMIAINAFRR